MSRPRVKLQQGEQDCLLACYSMLLGSHGLSVLVHELYDEQMLPPDGLSARYLKQLDARFSATTRVFRSQSQSAQDILTVTGRPVIVHWANNHYVVLVKATKKLVTIIDPAVGTMRITPEVFELRYSGVFMHMPERPTGTAQSIKVPRERSSLVRVFVSHHAGVLVLGLVLGQLVSLGLAAGVREILSTKHLVIVSLFVLGLVLCAQVVAHVIRVSAQVQINERFEKVYSANIFSGLLRQPFLYFKNHTSGSLLEKLSLRTSLRDSILSGALPSLINFLSVAVLIVYLGWISLELTVLAIGLSLVFSLCCFLNLRNQTDANQNYVQHQVEFTSQIQQDIASIDETKALRAERRVERSWIDRNDELRVSFNRVLRANGITSFVQQAYSSIALIVVASFGIFYYSKNMIELADVVVFQAGVSMLVASTSDLQNLIISVAKARIFEERQSDLARPRPRLEISDVQVDSPLVLQATGVGYVYPGGEPVFSRLDFDLSPGQKVAIVGESGSGKSTLMHALLGLVDHEGSITHGSPTFRSDLGIVLPGMRLRSGTVIGNLLESPSDAKRIGRVWAVLHDLNLDTVIRNLPRGLDSILLEGAKNLSTGQGQRLLIARSLIRGNRAVFWDEAFSSLDAANRDRIYKNILQGDLYAETAIVLISHQLDALEHVDTVIFLEEGNTVPQIGTHLDLLHDSASYREFLDRRPVLAASG